MVVVTVWVCSVVVVIVPVVVSSGGDVGFEFSAICPGYRIEEDENECESGLAAYE